MVQQQRNGVYYVARADVCSGESPAVNRGLNMWYLGSVIQWDCCSSCVRIRCQETASGECNRLRTLVCVCQWSVKCSHESWVYKWSTNRVTNPNPVYSDSYTWQYISAHCPYSSGRPPATTLHLIGPSPPPPRIFSAAIDSYILQRWMLGFMEWIGKD
jgi:hypothetical protein